MPRRRLQSWVLLFCAAALLLAQLTGAHYHRHVGHLVDAPGAHVHLRDAGMHAAIDQDHHGAHEHHADGDHATHPGHDMDVEVDSSATTFAKFFTSTLALGLLLAVLWRLQPPRGVRLPRIAAVSLRLRPHRFSLLPPSHAPPFDLSRA